MDDESLTGVVSVSVSGASKEIQIERSTNQTCHAKISARASLETSEASYFESA